MALVDEDDGIMRKIIEQRGRSLARHAAGEVARIVLDAVAIPDLLDHLQIEHRPLPEPLRLDQLVLVHQFRMPPSKLFFDATASRFAVDSGVAHSASWDKSAIADMSAVPARAADRSATGSRSHRPRTRSGRRSRRTWDTTSTTSPRTRNVPRRKSPSLRSYRISTSRAEQFLARDLLPLLQHQRACRNTLRAIRDRRCN